MPSEIYGGGHAGNVASLIFPKEKKHMCANCRARGLRGLKDRGFRVPTSLIPAVPEELVSEIIGKVGAPEKGAVVVEPAWLGVVLVAIECFMRGEKNMPVSGGFVLPLSARTVAVDNAGLPLARYVPAECATARDSLRRLAFSATARAALGEAVEPFGIVIETFSCGGIFVFPREKREEALADIRALQMIQSKLDQLNRENQDPMPLSRLVAIGVDLSEVQVAAIELAAKMCDALAGRSGLPILVASAA